MVAIRDTVRLFWVEVTTRTERSTGITPAGEVTLTAHDSGSWKFVESIARKRFRCGDGTASAFLGLHGVHHLPKRRLSKAG